jgi:hypothetical protein
MNYHELEYKKKILLEFLVQLEENLHMEFLVQVEENLLYCTIAYVITKSNCHRGNVTLTSYIQMLMTLLLSVCKSVSL